MCSPGFWLPPAGLGKTAAQRTAQVTLVSKVRRMVLRLATHGLPDGRRSLAELVGDNEFLGKPLTQPLKGACCDLLQKSATVDPLRFSSTDPQTQQWRDLSARLEGGGSSSPLQSGYSVRSRTSSRKWLRRSAAWLTPTTFAALAPVVT